MKMSHKESRVAYDPETGVVRTPPQHIFLELSSRCNLVCVHCSKDYGSPGGHPSLDMDIALVRHLCPWLHQAHFVNLNMVGEPLLHPEFSKILKLASPKVASSHRPNLSFNTNGVLLNPEVDRLIVEQRVSHVVISLDGIESNEAIRGVPYELLKKRIAELAHIRRESGSDHPKIGIAYTLMRRNLHELPRVMADLCPSGDIDEVHVQPLIVFYEGLVGENAYRQPEVQSVLSHCQTTARKFGTSLRVFRSTFTQDERYSSSEDDPVLLGQTSVQYGCIDPFYEIKIRSTGDIMACSNGLTPGLNVKDLTLDEAWNHSWYRDLRKNLAAKSFKAECERCSFIFGEASNQEASLRPGVHNSAEPRFMTSPRAVNDPAP